MKFFRPYMLSQISMGNNSEPRMSKKKKANFMGRSLFIRQIEETVSVSKKPAVANICIHGEK